MLSNACALCIPQGTGWCLQAPVRVLGTAAHPGAQDSVLGSAGAIHSLGARPGCAASSEGRRAVSEDRKYAKSHEWAKVDGDVATIGISDFAQVGAPPSSRLAAVARLAGGERSQINPDRSGCHTGVLRCCKRLCSRLLWRCRPLRRPAMHLLAVHPQTATCAPSRQGAPEPLRACAAQAELGDIVYVEMPEVGSQMESGAVFGVVESVKARRPALVDCCLVNERTAGGPAAR